MIFQLPWKTFEQQYREEMEKINIDQEAFRRGLEAGHKLALEQKGLA